MSGGYSRPGTATRDNTLPCSRPGSRAELGSRCSVRSGKDRAVSRGSAGSRGHDREMRESKVRFSVLKDEVPEPNSEDNSANDRPNIDDDTSKSVPVSHMWALRKTRAEQSAYHRAKLGSLIADQQRYLDYTYNGFLIDYLVRLRAGKGGTGDRAKMLLDPDTKGIDDATMGTAGALFGGVEIVMAEKLKANLKQIITMYYKLSGCPEWRLNGNAFKSQALKLVAERHTANLLDVEVNNCLFISKLRRGMYKAETLRGERPKDRQRRLNQFSTFLHASHKQATSGNLSQDGHCGMQRQSSQGMRRQTSGGKAGSISPDTSGTRKASSFSQDVSGSRRSSNARRSSNEKAEGLLSVTAAAQQAAHSPKKSSTTEGWKLRSFRGISRGGQRRNDAIDDDLGTLPRLGNHMRAASRGSDKFASSASSFFSMAARSDFLRSSSSFYAGDGADDYSSTPVGSGKLPALQSPVGFREWGFASNVSAKSDTTQLPTKSRLTASTPNLPTMVKKPVMEKPESLVPHRKPGKGQDELSSLATRRYVQACQKNFVLPSLMPFCTGHSLKLIAANQNLRDEDLHAVTEMLGASKRLEEVDLDGNVTLTDKSLVPFLDRLQGNWVDSHLRRLSMRNCLSKAQIDRPDGLARVMSAVVQRLLNGFHRLKVLELSGIHMNLGSHLPLCQAISETSSIQKLALADICLSYDHPAIKQCLDLIFRGGSVEDLDLGWNAFDEDIFQYVGLGVVAAGSIKRLGVANCAQASPHGSSSAEAFLETLERDRNLTHLDISINRIDFRGALVLEAVLENNPTLKFFDISQNPLASLGYRSILRLLCRPTSALKGFECEGCTSGANVVEMSDEGGYQVFTETNPGGRYCLQLERPYHRALLKMLYRTCTRFKTSPNETFHDVTPAGYVHPVQEPSGIWPVPTEGKLALTFSLEEVMNKFLAGVSDGDFAGMLEKHFSLTRLSPPKTKEIALFTQWKNREGQRVEQLTLLEAMSKDFQFSYPQFVVMCRTRGDVAEVAWRLLPCVTGRERTRFLSLLQMPCISSYVALMKRAQKLLNFNVENPTGNYDLDLGNWLDSSIAEQLLLLDRWECSVASRRKLEVVSQTGIPSQVRNPKYLDRPIVVRVISEFILPESGQLKFDYVSSKRPAKDASPLDSHFFDQILLAMQNSECSPTDKIHAVGLTSHFWYLSSLQMRTVMGIFKDSHIRAEIFVRLAMRLIDLQHEKIFRSRFQDKSEFQHLQDRLGHLTFLPFIQPEQTEFVFDFAVWDQRSACNLLLNLATEESRGNLQEFSYTRLDGTVDQLPLGIPRSWDSFDKMPTTGTFRMSYICSPEDRKYKTRRALARRYGFYEAPEDESDVLWWSSITHCPEDVIEFVEFLNSHFKNIWIPFHKIDGDGGNGNVSWTEFKEGLKIIGCDKFLGQDSEQRARIVFRYLDPSGEGQVSKDEWAVLEQILQSIQLCIKEFVEFCVRTFGSNLNDAWHRLDADGSGEIDRAEWLEACESLGFFGLANPIFSFLDKDDEGTVSQDEFALLKKYQDGKSLRRVHTMKLDSKSSDA